LQLGSQVSLCHNSCSRQRSCNQLQQTTVLHKGHQGHSYSVQPPKNCHPTRRVSHSHNESSKSILGGLNASTCSFTALLHREQRPDSTQVSVRLRGLQRNRAGGRTDASEILRSRIRLSTAYT
ncbi:hypothetical protein XENOCAPTIV_020599, partial [Xenoophorus captivus]